MRNLAQTKTRFLIALAAMAVVDIALITYLMWPGNSPSALEEQRKTLHQKTQAITDEVKPLQNMDVKLGKTRTNIKTLYLENIPARSSQISQQLEKLTRQTGVATQSIHYNLVKADKGDLPDVQRVGVETTVTGDYAKVAHFINALEQSDLLFIIDQVTLNGQESGLVTLQIKFQTFLKETA